MAIFNVKDYGAYGDGIQNDTNAFIAASAALTAAGGGTLLIPAGVYMVGKQDFAGKANQGYAYRATDIITISNCTKPVIIEGSAAVLRIVPNLKFGSFDPITGNPYYPASMPFTNVNYAAGIGRMVVLSNNSSQVLVRNLELDGSINSAVLGGSWGDQGYQLAAYGLYTKDCPNLRVSNVYSHHHCLDGLYIAQSPANATATTPRTPATLINVRCEFNARQGFSWVGGGGVTAIGCKFNHTGRAAFGSSPQAGVDIEASGGALVRNGLFINCEMINNVGLGMGADSGDSADVSFINCTFLGTTYYCAWPSKPRMHFADCTFSGITVRAYADPVNSKGYSTQFSRCLFTDKLKYNSLVYAPGSTSYLVDFGVSGAGVKLDACVIDAATTRIGYSSNYGTVTATNCQFYQQVTGSGTESAFRAICVGDTVLNSGSLAQLDQSVVLGRASWNGTEYPQTTNMPQRRQQLWANNGSGGSQQHIGYGSSPADFLGSNSAQLGDIVFNSDAVSGAPAGWVCVSSGSPGTWKAFATIAS